MFVLTIGGAKIFQIEVGIFDSAAVWALGFRCFDTPHSRGQGHGLEELKMLVETTKILAKASRMLVENTKMVVKTTTMLVTSTKMLVKT